MNENIMVHSEKTDIQEKGNDIRLTVLGLNRGGDGEYTLDFALVWSHIRRLFPLWLCLAVILGALSGAAGLLAQKRFVTEPVRALVSFPSQIYDIIKIKSPGMVEATLEDLGVGAEHLDKFRNLIEIDGIIPDSATDQMSMYYSIIEQAGVNGVQSLLNVNYSVNHYVISFDYTRAKLLREDGINFMNALLRNYQDYIYKTYNYNDAMGSALSALDYRDYDYAEAANIFSTALNNLTSYLSSVESSETTTFRSTQTGFTFQDLRRSANTLQRIDLDRISSYIVIHSVSSYDAETEISYYEWLTDNLTRQRAVQTAKLESLTASIEAYEKDPVLIAMQDGNSVISSMDDLNANYDNMITQKLEAEAAIASCTRSISFYERMIEGFRDATASTPADIAKVEKSLASLSEKVTALLDAAARTVNEYYERMEFANRVQVLIPASGKSVAILSRLAVIVVLVTELLLGFVFVVIVCLMGLRRENGPEDQKRADTAWTAVGSPESGAAVGISAAEPLA